MYAYIYIFINIYNSEPKKYFSLEMINQIRKALENILNARRLRWFRHVINIYIYKNKYIYIYICMYIYIYLLIYIIVNQKSIFHWK